MFHLLGCVGEPREEVSIDVLVGEGALAGVLGEQIGTVLPRLEIHIQAALLAQQEAVSVGRSGNRKQLFNA